MIVDNTEQIKKLIAGCNQDEFYMVQILHRDKDGENPFNNGGHKGQQTIKSYFISSPDYLDYKMPEIKAMCEMFNARAYINLNKKSNKQVNLKALEILAHNIASEEYTSMKSLFETACGQTGACDKDKSWIVDVDTKDNMELAEVMKIINLCEPFDIQKVKAVIPTLHGFHIISRPFNKQRFNKLYEKQIDIHDNNPTVLYFRDRKDIIAEEAYKHYSSIKHNGKFSIFWKKKDVDIDCGMTVTDSDLEYYIHRIVEDSDFICFNYERKD